jgi:S1-C subfamily serine protease
VNEILRQPALDRKSFDKRRDLDVWPLPENVGIVLDRDDGLLVKRIERGSAAERAGLAAGDRLAAAGDRKLFGQADFRGVLHRGPRGVGALEVRAWRGAELRTGVLELADGWRATVLGWRKSVADGNIGAAPGFAWPLEVKAEERRKRGIAENAMAVKPFFGKQGESWPASTAGLREDDVIVAVGGKSPNVAQREFMTWFRLQYEPGDAVVLTVRDSRGRERQIRYTAPAPHGG